MMGLVCVIVLWAMVLVTIRCFQTWFCKKDGKNKDRGGADA